MGGVRRREVVGKEVKAEAGAQEWVARVREWEEGVKGDVKVEQSVRVRRETCALRGRPAAVFAALEEAS